MAGAILSGVSKVYGGGVKALDAVDLEVAGGELLVLVGPSGSGKTTLLRLIAGLDYATTGSISIGAQQVNGLPARRRNVAMVFQSHAIYPHWTAYENMAFGVELREFGGLRHRLFRRLARPLWPERFARHEKELHARIVTAARMLDIESLLDRPASELSGGEEQRLALGRAVLREPALFLFDEPLSNLDAQLRVELRRQLKQLHARLGATMIYVTHDQSEALALGDRIAVLHRGRIEQIGPPLELYEHPANPFVAGFIGSPGMNFFQATRTGEEWQFSAAGWAIKAAGGTWRGGKPGESALVGLRPNDLHVRRLDEPPPDGDWAPPDSDWLRLRATVGLIEYQGDSCLVTLFPENIGQSAKQASPESPGAVLLGKALFSSGLKPGEPIIAWFDMRRAHWFDGQSGRNLRPASEK